LNPISPYPISGHRGIVPCGQPSRETVSFSIRKKPGTAIEQRLEIRKPGDVRFRLDADSEGDEPDGPWFVDQS